MRPMQERLEALSVALGVAGRLFYEDPDKGVVDALLPMREALLGEPFSLVAPEGARALSAALARCADDPEACMDELRQDRAYLFYQVSYSRTSPYESVYRTEDRTLFGPTTAQVKRAYERHGLGLASGRNEPCDHFGLECTFCSRVAAAGVDALDESTAAGAERELARFMGEHLLVFAPVYLGNVEAQARSGYYRAAALLARETLAWAADAVGAVPAEVLDPADFPVKGNRG